MKLYHADTKKGGAALSKRKILSKLKDKEEHNKIKGSTLTICVYI